jgi:glycosyltransferase involved in cell wall biosynthesis
VENTWRKNLYTQVIAAQGSKKVRRICLVNWPTYLDGLMVLEKAQLVGFQSLPGLLAHMRLAQLVANVSFSECQPMTQLEALAMGTPAIVGPLRLPVFSGHLLSELCEAAEFDDPGLLRQRFDLVIDEWSRDPVGLSEMISDFVTLRTAAGLASYKEFLEL